MRLPRISLAAKYRLLFGAAVLLIIGAALAVPWYRMEALVLEQPFREAQRIVDDYFRLVMHKPGAPGQTIGPLTNELGLLPTDAGYQPRYIPLDPKSPSGQSLPAELLSDRFIARSLLAFMKDPNQNTSFVTRNEPTGRRLYYAHAVRVTKSCLACHSEGDVRPAFQDNQLAGIITVDLPADLTGGGMLWNRIVLIAAGALAGTLAILVFYGITQRFILSPIHELREVTIRVADGDLSVRSQVQTGDEFEQLSANLNNMLERLRQSQEELRRANQLLDEKLGQMAETNVALYEANRVKSEFIANVSHELRTPLTSIIGFAELLREGPQSGQNERLARYAENILISGRILLEIINDLLDLAKIEAGKVELRIEDIDLATLCRDLMDFTRPQAEARQLVFELHADEDLPTLATDINKLRQVLFNLLSNAIKFTPPGGSVRVSAARVGTTHVRVAVTDSGPGIAPENQEIIFDKFRQIDQSATREHHGTGLGLAIARELTELLGGQIGVESALGAGSTFWITLSTDAPQPRERAKPSLV